MEDASGEVKACVRAQVHHPTTDASKLGVYKSAIAKHPEWQGTFSQALKTEMDLARLLQIPMLEVGGLALHESVRGTSAVLKLVIAIYGLAKNVGGAVGLSTVTTRHGASSILRRLGGESMSHSGIAVPPYYDPQYRCDMEVLKFYSWKPSLRHEARFAEVQQFTTQEVSKQWQTSRPAERSPQIHENALADRVMTLNAYA
ncbi:MAG: hypothetical protein ABI811_13610 [Acidobacteriota bacterium]